VNNELTETQLFAMAGGSAGRADIYQQLADDELELPIYLHLMEMMMRILVSRWRAHQV
jgi:hypothetical protein